MQNGVPLKMYKTCDKVSIHNMFGVALPFPLARGNMPAMISCLLQMAQVARGEDIFMAGVVMQFYAGVCAQYFRVCRSIHESFTAAESFDAAFTLFKAHEASTLEGFRATDPPVPNAGKEEAIAEEIRPKTTAITAVKHRVKLILRHHNSVDGESKHRCVVYRTSKCDPKDTFQR